MSIENEQYIFVNTEIDVKKRKLFNIDFLKIQYDIIVKNYFKNNNYDHDWLNYIYYYEINNKILIYFKTQYLITIDNLRDLNEQKINILIKKTIECIKIKNILLPIYYLPDIINLEKNIEELYKYNSNGVSYQFLVNDRILIDFFIINDEINFETKGYNFFKCKIKMFTECYYDIINEYNKIKYKKKKILFLGDTGFRNSHFSDMYCLRDLEILLLNKNFWLDFVSTNWDTLYVLSNKLLFFLYYDIIIFTESEVYDFIDFYYKNDNNLNLINDKIIIIFRTEYSWDLKKWTSLIKNNIKNKNKNKNIYYLQNGMIGEHKLINKMFFKQFYKNFLDNFSNIGYMVEIPNYIQNNNNLILSKNEFCKIFNLDPNKKIITIFLDWPAISKGTEKHDACTFIQRKLLRDLLYSNNKFINNLCNSFKNNNCNVIFKIHPRGLINIINNKLYINQNIVFTNNFTGSIIKLKDLIDKDWGIMSLIKKNIFVDNSFFNEIMEHTDYAVTFTRSFVGFHSYLNDIPILYISSNKIDSNWFDFFNKKDIWYNNVKTVDKDNHFKDEYSFNKFNNLEKNIIRYESTFNKPLFKQKENNKYLDLFYGEFVYKEDIENNIDFIIKKFLNKNYKKYLVEKNYINNHPLYKNSYECKNKKKYFSEISIKLIKLFKNIKINNKLKIFFNRDLCTIYDSDNLSVNINCNNLIEIEITGTPSKSYGISLPVNNYNKQNLILEINAKIDFNEEAYLKVYTGYKWIVSSSPLKKTFTIFKFKDKFNFFNKSKWRISTTSKKIGQKIFLENIKFY